MAAAVNIKVNSDFSQASKDLKKFGNITEAERKKVEKFAKSFKTEQVDKFIDRNRRLGAATLSTRGKIGSLEAQTSALRRQTELLIKKGLDPEDAAVQRLQKEYTKLSGELDKAKASKKALSDATKAATTALKAAAVGAAAVGAAILKSSIDIGKMGDNLAKTSAKIGLGVEALQELSFAAERSGLPANSLGTIFQKLNRNIGDLQVGSGELTTILNKSNPELKEQLMLAKDSETAFALLTDAIAAAPTQFEKASLAQAAFGRSGQGLINFANQGSKEIGRLREEAARYGTISTEASKKAEAFVDSQRNLKQATIAFRTEAAKNLLPTMTKALNGFADFVAEGDKLRSMLSTLGLVLAGLTGGLAAFLVVTKGAAAVHALAAAFRAFNAAIAANPIGAIAFVITSVLIPAIILLVKNWDKVVIAIQTGVAVLGNRFEMLGVNLKIAWITAINVLKIGFLGLANAINEGVLGAVGKLLDVAAKLPGVGGKFAEMSANVAAFGDASNQALADAQRRSVATIQSSQAEAAAIRAASKVELQAIKEGGAARQAALIEMEEQTEKEIAIIAEKEIAINEIKMEAQAAGLAERLEALQNAEAIAAEENLIAFTDFLNARMAQEQIAGDQRIAFLKSELSRIESLEGLSNAERLAAAKAVEAEITKNKKAESEARNKLARQSLSVAAGVFGALSDLAELSAEESRAGAIAARAFASFEAGINAALAVTKVFAELPLPLAIPAATAIGIKTGVEIHKINSAPLPSAETGTPLGGITVPRRRGGAVDNIGVLAGEGETISVSPRGGGNQTLNITVNIDEQTLISVINQKIESQEIIISTENIQNTNIA